MRALIFLLWLAPNVARDGADEQYAFIAGLAEKGLSDRVVKEAQSFLEHYPRHPKADSARYRLACAWFDLHDAAKATVEFQRLAARGGFEFEAEVAFRLGQCELQQGDCKSAETEFARVLALKKDYLAAPAEWMLGEARLHCERFDAAAEAYRACLALAPRGEYADDSLAGLAWCAFKSKRFDEALEDARRYTANFAKGERVDELRFLAGESLFELARPKESLESYGAVGQGPWIDGALRGAGFAYAALGEHELAARVFQRVVDEHAESRFSAECRLHAGIEWLAAKDAKKATELLESKTLDTDGDALAWRSRAQAANGNVDAALATLDRALALAKDDQVKARLRSSRADLLASQGKRDEAAREYERAGSDYALQAAAVAALQAGRAADARRLAENLIQRFPASNYLRDAWMVVGEAQLTERDFSGASKSFETAANGEPDAAKRTRAQSRLAWCAYLGGDARAAAERFAALARESANTPEIDEAAFMQARSLEAANDIAGARSSYDAYVARFPSGARADEAEFRSAKLDSSADGLARLEHFLAREHTSEFAAKARYELAERLSSAGRLADAIARYRELLERHGDSELAPAARYGLAWCLAQSEDAASAVALLRPWIADANGDAELRASALELLVWSESKLTPPDGVADAWRAFVAVSKDPERTLRAARAASEALRKAGHADAALALFDDLAARVKEPKIAGAIALERVYLRLDQKKVDDAERELGRARSGLRGDAGVAEAAYFVGDARMQGGDQQRALELFDLAAENATNPLRDRALYKAGFARLANDDAAGAERSLATLVSQCPKSTLIYEALFLLGESQYRQKKFEAAEAALVRVQKEAPASELTPKVLFRLGLTRAEREDWKGALEALTALAARKANFENAAEAELVRGRALAHLNRPRDATSAFERTIALDKGVLSARAHLELGQLHFGAKELEPALSEFLKVAVLYDLPEETAEALLRAGQTLEAQGDAPRAAEQYREVLAKHPKSSSAPAAKARLAELDSKDKRGV